MILLVPFSPSRFCCTALAFVLALGSVGAADEAPGWAVAVFPSGSEFSLEIAADPATQARGYMFRESVGPKEGMLFLYERDERPSFWMKNCKVPLDIIWIDSLFRVVQIAHDRPPCPDEGPCPSISPEQPARYVLEVAGGTARRERLVPGDSVVVLSEPSLR